MIKALIAREFERRKKKGPKYSMRSFAKSLGISPSFMSKVLNDKAKISEDLLKKILQNLDLTSQDLSELPQNLLPEVHMEPSSPLSLDASAVFAAVSTAEGIARSGLSHLNFSSERIDQAVNQLIVQNRIIELEGRLEVVFLNSRQELVGTETRKTMSRQLYEQRDIAYDKCPEHVHNTNLTVRISDDCKQLVINEMVNFQKRLNMILEKDQGTQRVFCINTSLFPISEPIEEK